MSRQQTTLTVSEGGIPPTATHALDLIGAAEQAVTSPNPQQSNDSISTVPVEQSLGIPFVVDSTNPHDWPENTGVPQFRPLDMSVDSSDKPLGQNNVEYTFLIFMFTGVMTVGVSEYKRRNNGGADNMY